MSRAERVNEAIQRGDIAELLTYVDFGPCACLGSEDGEPLCICRMNSKQVRDAISYAGLKRGVLVYNKPTAR